MKRYILLATIFLPALLLSQPEITFDSETDLSDWDEIYTDTIYKRDVWFTNTGDSALIISGISSSDGGLFASRWPHTEVQAGERANFMIIFNTQGRKGNFNRTIYIRSNAHNYNRYINIKGRIKVRGTSIKVLKKDFNLDTLLYGAMDTIAFEVVNTGRHDLFAHLVDIHSELDILYCSKFDKNQDNTLREGCKPGATLQFTLVIKNVFGDVGSFERKLLLNYNDSCDTITLKCVHVGRPCAETTFEGENVLFYEDGKLVKVKAYGSGGTLRWVKFYNDGPCYYSISYHTYGKDKGKIYREEYFKKGVSMRVVKH